MLTPSGIAYHDLKPEDIIYVEFNHAPQSPHKPSSKWLFHRDILINRTDVNAVIHTHSNYATAKAIQGMEIPAHHYMVAATGGPVIRCAEYAAFETRKLSEKCAKRP